MARNDIVIDRSLDGAGLRYRPVHLVQLSSGNDGENGQYMALLHIDTPEGPENIGFCPHCAQRLLDMLLKMKEMQPKMFAE